MSKLHSRNIKWLSTVLHALSSISILTVLTKNPLFVEKWVAHQVKSQYRGMAVNGLRPGLLTQDHFNCTTGENIVQGSNVYIRCVVASIKIPESRCDLP